MNIVNIFALVTAAISVCVSADTVNDLALSFGPYPHRDTSVGNSGYQEIQLGEHSWYVAYHGNRETSLNWLNIAWAARAAQLCQNADLQYFVRLRYVNEPVLLGEKLAYNGDFGWYQKAHGSSVFVPIVVPSGASPIGTIITPSVQAAIRCVSSQAELIDPTRIVSVKESLDKAAASGLSLK